jgi:hypothetical protein
VDYKAFLSKTEMLVLPYFGGTRVDTSDKRLRIDLDKSRVENLTPGWWQFQVEGRNAYPTERASPTDLSMLPAVRGHWVSGWVVLDGRSLARISFPPEDEPSPLSRVTARRWYSHDLLFDSTDFEDDAELVARAALEERRPLTDVKGVVPSLRTAFGIALGMTLARELDVEITPPELVRDAVRIADAGRETVRTMFQAILDERERAAREARERAEREAIAARLRIEEAEARECIAGAVVSARALERGGRRPDAREGRAGRNRRKDNSDPARRADDALDQAGARMLSTRLLAGGTQIDVTYEVDGTRIISLCDAQSLQILDPGICLSGAHRVLTLDAMPSVVREAIEVSHLNITRRA